MRTAVLETSIDAFHAHGASGKKEAQRSRILAFIDERGGDWTIGELANRLNMEKSTVSARLNELLYETKDLVECAKRKDRISGITVRPVCLPTAQFPLALTPAKQMEMGL